ncbi:MAG: uroporphyrinogen decarboxylase family protein [Gemmataceae bacterium]
MKSATEHLLVRALLGKPIERPPVWAMRQAGRWDPQFQALRQGIGFFEFSEDVERATKATLCPRRFGVDAIILFYDITTLPVAMGLPFQLKTNAGPVPDRPIHTLADLKRLNPEPQPDSYGHIVELLKRVKAELNGELPVLAFAGAPYTVASYCIGTGKDVAATRRFAAEQPAVWDGLLQTLQHATELFLKQLIADGADAYQLFDSWAGMLTPEEYDRWAQPFHSQTFASVKSAPSILFVKECPYLEKMCETGATAISLGRRHDLAACRKQYPHLTFQGNVDEKIMRQGTPEQVTAEVKRVLAEGGGQRHIVNLSHGMGKESPVANFEAFIRAVKE